MNSKEQLNPIVVSDIELRTKSSDCFKENIDGTTKKLTRKFVQTIKDEAIDIYFDAHPEFPPLSSFFTNFRAKVKKKESRLDKKDAFRW